VGAVPAAVRQLGVVEHVAAHLGQRLGLPLPDPGGCRRR
jgi:hypothetical protein